MHDIKQKGTWSRVKITDRTKNKHGLPTFLAMTRSLTKEIKNA